MKKIAICGATFMALLACSQIQEEDPGVLKTKELTFTAYRAEADTKTERQPGGSVYWNPSDAVSVFFINGDNGGSKFVAQNTEAVATAQFKGTIDVISGGGEGENHEFWFWGVYPYSSENSCDGSSITTVIPKTQEGKAGTFADNTFVTMARSKGLSLGFYNICTGVKFTLTRDDIKEVRIRGNKGEDLAGKVNVEWDANGKPAITQYVDGAKEVAVTAPGGGTFATGTEYYLVLAPTLFTEGFTMSLVTDDEKLGYFVHGNERQFNRGIFINISNLDTRVTSWVDIAAKEVPEEGGNVELEVMSSEPCHAVIPEDAQSWISEVPSTKSVEKKTITLKVEPNTGEARSADVTIEQEDGTVLLSYRIEQQTNHDYQLTIEREALIAIYNALDGDHWTNKDNWCSDKPLSEWYGITTNTAGNVYSIDLYDNNLSGQIPKEIGKLSYLTFLRFRNDEIKGYIPIELFQLSKLVDLTLCGLYFDDGTIPMEINNLASLQDLQISSLNGEIIFPSSLEGLKNLRNLFLGYHINEIQQPSIKSLSFLKDLKNLDWLDINYLKVSIPECIGELNNLSRLCISNCIIENNSIPTTIGNLQNLKVLDLSFNSLSCELPKEIGNLSQLDYLNLYQTPFAGTIPREFGNLTALTNFQVGCNSFSGKLPQEVASLPIAKTMWPRFYDHTGLDLSDCSFPAPDFVVKDLNGSELHSDKLYANHKLTVLFEWATWCPDTPLYADILKNIYSDYQNQDVFILGYGEEDSLTDENTARQFVSDNNYPWPNVFWTYDNSTATVHNEIYRITVFPLVCVYDQENRIIFNTYSNNVNSLQGFISDYLSDKDWYKSTDYTSDGTTTTLQQSTTGNGVDLIFMGDAFSDRQIADGTYANVMQKAADAFFSEEPYKSMKDRFNVYTVNVVSATEGYEHSGQALSTGHGDGTYVYGNDSKVIEYAKKAISEDRLDDAVIIVMMNEDAYAGTCFMYNPPSGNYGRGLSIAYFPTSSDTDTFNGLVSHEAGGHGFAKLADEYAYEYMGAISSDAIANTKVNEAYGWWKNVDFTSDPAQVKWSQFLSDPCYASEGLGCFEGGLTYWTGVWRPTDASIMRYNTGGFNAPSRYAIWYRIGKLAYGESWEGTYEDFVAYDAINRTPAAVARRDAQRRRAVQKPLPQLPPPVVVGHSWREELQKGK